MGGRTAGRAAQGGQRGASDGGGGRRRAGPGGDAAGAVGPVWQVGAPGRGRAGGGSGALGRRGHHKLAPPCAAHALCGRHTTNDSRLGLTHKLSAVLLRTASPPQLLASPTSTPPRLPPLPNSHPSSPLSPSPPSPSPPPPPPGCLSCWRCRACAATPRRLQAARCSWRRRCWRTRVRRRGGGQMRGAARGLGGRGRQGRGVGRYRRCTGLRGGRDVRMYGKGEGGPVRGEGGGRHPDPSAALLASGPQHRASPGALTPLTYRTPHIPYTLPTSPFPPPPCTAFSTSLPTPPPPPQPAAGPPSPPPGPC